jgi:hypothetical protein
LASALFSAAVTTLLYAGWRARDAGYLAPQSGLGYALGVAGATMMALLLLYPVRKHARFLRHWGAVRHWFRAHMLLGIIGPVCVAFHCNFSVGSVNSRVALGAMVVVVASGIIGRHLYTKIHHGLYGRRATLEEQERALRGLEQRLDAAAFTAAHRARMAELASLVSEQPRSIVRGLARVIRLGVATRLWTAGLRASRLRESLSGKNDARRRESGYLAVAYAASIRRVAEFWFYERLFALWHVLHVPLFVLLLLATVAHVIAVHRY